MNTVIGAFVMILGLILIGWNLYCLYHHLPLSPLAFGAGAVCAFFGSRWVQGKSSSTI